MSQIENVLTTTFRARDGGVIAQLGSYAQGFGTIYNRLSDNSRMSDRLNAQWRAFGTTLRYAIAGQTIFGLTSMLGKLRDMNMQLGEMAALTTAGTGGSAFSQSQITSLENQLQKTAIDTLTPLSQVNDAAINFLSTVQQVQPGKGLPEMLGEISKAAQVAQTDLTTLNQAATTSQIAFGRPVNQNTIGQFTRMWQELILKAPGGPQASTAIAQAMPGLASMFQLGRGQNVAPGTAQAQMMAMTLGVLRTGMPAATAMRGLTYLLQSLAQPTGKARGALAGIGITPEFIQQNGINAALMRLLGTITKTGNAKALAQIPDDTLDQIDQAGGTLPGIPASEMTRLRTMIPRIHGIRAAIILASQLLKVGNVESLSQDLQDMLDVQDENSKQTRALAKAWDRYRQRARLQEAANAINVMSLQVAQMFEPVFGFVAQHAITPLANAMQHHRTAAKIGVGAVGLGIGALAVRRLLGFGGGNTLARIEAAHAAVSGSTALGATPQNPLFVIVVGQLFSGSTSTKGLHIPGTKTKIPGSGSEVGKDIEKIGGGGGLATIFGAAVKYGRRITRSAGRVARRGENMLGSMEEGTSGFFDRFGTKAIGRAAWPMAIFDYFYNAQNAGSATADIFPAVKKMFPNLTKIESATQGTLHGHAEVYLTLDINQGGKVTRKRVHIPLDMLNSGGRVPSARGTAGKTMGRGNG